MQQSLALTLISLLLFFTGLFGGNAPGDSLSPPPAFRNPWQPSSGASTPASAGSGPFGTAPTLRTSTGVTVAVGGTVLPSEKRINLRSGPGTGYRLVAQAGKGTPLTALEAKSKWLKVRTPGGQVAWVADWLVQPGTAVATGALRRTPLGYEVWGYYDTDGTNSALDVLRREARNLTAVVPFAFRLRSDGSIADHHPSQAMSVAKSAGLDTLALIHNYSGDYFSSQDVDALLRSASARHRAIQSMLHILRAYGYRGVHLDLENVPPADRELLSGFVAEVAAALRPEGYLVTMAVPAKNQEDYANAWSGAFDYAALGASLDRVVVMAYDEHFRIGDPGPIASLPWVESVVRYAASRIPPEKILLGIPGYGYDWPLDGQDGRGISYQQAMQIARTQDITPNWSGDAQSPYFSYRSGGTQREVWFETASSLTPKIQLVQRFHLRGIALWRLGLEDPALWPVIARSLG